MVLVFTVYYLPLMFVYNLYVNYCDFVFYRRPSGLIENINRLLYGNVIFVDSSLMIIDGQPYEVDPDFGNEFLAFELNNYKLP